RDGDFVVYSSDRQGSGRRSLWMEKLPGEPIRITDGSSDDSEPSISSDGRHVVYRSDRDGGGVYVVPISGGAPQLVARRGRNPRFSPLGDWVVFWMGYDEETLSRGRVFIYDIRDSGGPSSGPKPLFADFAHVHDPIWSGDGQMVLAYGTKVSNVPEKEF